MREVGHEMLLTDLIVFDNGCCRLCVTSSFIMSCSECNVCHEWQAQQFSCVCVNALGDSLSPITVE